LRAQWVALTNPPIVQTPLHISSVFPFLIRPQTRQTFLQTRAPLRRRFERASNLPRILILITRQKSVEARAPFVKHGLGVLVVLLGTSADLPPFVVMIRPRLEIRTFP
jgi:hypothetical protein